MRTLRERIDAWKDNHAWEEQYRDSSRAPAGEFEVKLVALNGDWLVYRQTNENPHGDEEITRLTGTSINNEVREVIHD
jgi:hypothetical protein